MAHCTCSAWKDHVDNTSGCGFSMVLPGLFLSLCQLGRGPPMTKVWILGSSRRSKSPVVDP